MAWFGSDKELIITISQLKSNGERTQANQMEQMARNDKNWEEMKGSVKDLLTKMDDHKQSIHRDMEHQEDRICKKIGGSFVSTTKLDDDIKAERLLTDQAIDKSKKEIYFIVKIICTVIIFMFGIFEWVLVELPKNTHNGHNYQQPYQRPYQQPYQQPRREKNGS